jgi:hypothetical protein
LKANFIDNDLARLNIQLLVISDYDAVQVLALVNNMDGQELSLCMLGLVWSYIGHRRGVNEGAFNAHDVILAQVRKNKLVLWVFLSFF